MKIKISENQAKQKKVLFGITANYPEMWLSKGQELKRGANVIFESKTNNHLFMLLMAYAFENLLKGILICNDNKKESKVTLKKWKGLDHDLLRLSIKCKLSIDNLEKTF